MAAGIIKGGETFSVTGDGIDIGYWILEDHKQGGLLDTHQYSSTASSQGTVTLDANQSLALNDTTGRFLGSIQSFALNPDANAMPFIAGNEYSIDTSTSRTANTPGLLRFVNIVPNRLHGGSGSPIPLGNVNGATTASLNLGNPGTQVVFQVSTVPAALVAGTNYSIFTAATTEPAIVTYQGAGASGSNFNLTFIVIQNGAGFVTGAAATARIAVDAYNFEILGHGTQLNSGQSATFRFLVDSIDIPLTYQAGIRGHMTNGGNIYVPSGYQLTASLNIEAVFYRTL